MTVFKRKRGSKQDRYYTGKYKSPLSGKWVTVALRVMEKRVAETKLRDIVQAEEREAYRLTLPQPLVHAAALPLADHLREYLADLKALGRSKQYRVHQRGRIERLLRECGWRVCRDVTPDSFAAWRRREPQTAPRTLNHYLGAVVSFIEWMRRQGRIAANPLAAVGSVETRGRDRRLRRALTVDEARHLVAVAGRRAVMYLFALRTGVRRSEMYQLRWSDVRLGLPRPSFTVRASTAKNKREAVLPLAAEVADALGRLRGPVEAAGRVFAGLLPRTGLDFMRADLRAAGIEHVNAEGERVDFHALRHTFCTHLHGAGVGQRAAQELMRHSDPSLTARTYTDASLLPLFVAVDAVPSLMGGGTQIGTQAAVATCHKLASGGESIRVADGNASPVRSRLTAHSGTPRQGVSQRDQRIPPRGVEPLFSP